jgi:toxin ParE1/3/4
MAHRLAPEAETDLDGIWWYLARDSGSLDIADRVLDSITDRFLVLAAHPHIGRSRAEDLRPGLRSFRRCSGTDPVPACGSPSKL